jgi:hypothetical protein
MDFFRNDGKVLRFPSPDIVIPIGFQNAKIDVINVRNLLVHLERRMHEEIPQKCNTYFLR